MKSNTEISNHGFTLTELLVGIAISGVVMAGIYSVYHSQQKSQMVQEQVVAMQQNLRAAMYMMSREIRMAGYDPQFSAGAVINIANVAELEFTVDYNGDGNFTNPTPPPANDSNEQIRYHLTNDADDDGIADGIPCNLGREIWGGGLQTIAENIDVLEFFYLNQTNTQAFTIADIRSVQIAIVARAGRAEPGLVNNTQYRNLQGTVIYTAPGDNFRRMVLTAHVRCRNL